MAQQKMLSVGIDESTAVIVDPSKREATVIGKNSVTVTDARAAKAEGEGKGSERSWRDVKLHWLRAGMKFNY